MHAEIGIIGGSGFYSLFDRFETASVETAYGRPSDEIAIGEIEGRKVAFLPRHGRKHNIPPQKVPYRANIDALAKLGVRRIIATSAVGSLKESYEPGSFVLFDQFVNMTHGRPDTYYDQDTVAHVSMADPYCASMRRTASSVMKELGLKHHESGTVVVISGPRFSTRSESRFFGCQGFETINMTQYPEAALAREKALCYLGIGIVTDYDVGVEGREEIKPVELQEVYRVFGLSIDSAKKAILEMIPRFNSSRDDCQCSKALDNAVVGH